MRKHSKRYQQAVKELDTARVYTAEEALELVKKTSTVKFDASVEVHVRLGIDPKQTDQQVRFAVSLPHGTGKKLVIAAFVTPGKEKEAKAAGAELVGGDELVNEIKQSGNIKFDVAVAEPAMMKNLAPIAKILGTKGKMPSPKTGTVTPNIAQAIKEIVGGRVDVKNDDSAIIHLAIGKVSFEAGKLKENFETFNTALKNARPKGAKQDFIRGVSITSSMGPAFKVKA
jgi:large subunit ribosomal protein L1